MLIIGTPDLFMSLPQIWCFEYRIPPAFLGDMETRGHLSEIVYLAARTRWEGESGPWWSFIQIPPQKTKRSPNKAEVAFKYAPLISSGRGNKHGVKANWVPVSPIRDKMSRRKERERGKKVCFSPNEEGDALPQMVLLFAPLSLVFAPHESAARGKRRRLSRNPKELAREQEMKNKLSAFWHKRVSSSLAFSSFLHPMVRATFSLLRCPLGENGKWDDYEFSLSLPLWVSSRSSGLKGGNLLISERAGFLPVHFATPGIIIIACIKRGM